MFNINIYITVGVRKRDGTEYKPDTLTGIQNSIDRHLKNLKSKVDIKKDEQFTQIKYFLYHMYIRPKINICLVRVTL
jgi:hypothetical protein